MEKSMREQPENQYEVKLREIMERCSFAIDNFNRFEQNPNNSDSWATLHGFVYTLYGLEAMGPQEVQMAMQDRYCHSDLEELLQKIKTSSVIDFEEKSIKNKTALPSIQEAEKMIIDVKEAILRLEIYLSSRI